MARKPDLFEQMVERLQLQSPSGNYYKGHIVRAEVVKLLRRHHAKVRTMVRLCEGINKALCHNEDFRDGYIAAAQDIQKDLDTLKKGKP